MIFQVLYSFITFGVSRDPEVISEYDPPDHLFRIRLVTTLLDTCGQFFSSGSSKKKLDCFLTYFQFYYLFKKFVWTGDEDVWCHMDHIVKDTISTVRPKLKLFNDLKEAQSAVVALNEQFLAKALEQVPALKKFMVDNTKDDQSNNNNKTGDTSLPTIPENEQDTDVDLNVKKEKEKENESKNEPIEEDEDEEDESDDDEVGRRDDNDADVDWSEAHGDSLTPSQHSQSTSSRLPFHDTMGRLTQDGEDMDEEEDSSRHTPLDVGGGTTGTGEEISSSGDVKVTLNHVSCEEDDDFMSAFDKMMADSVIERTREAPSRQGISSISVPIQAKSSTKKTYEQLLSEDGQEKEDKSVVNFVLMTRSGNKSQLTNIEMPGDCDLVAKLRNREVAEREEREKVKRMTLEMNERQEEEEAQEMLQQAQRPLISNCNRDRRPKYQHPKGAPDADLIFGPKRVR